MKLYTRTGDSGTTAVFGGGRVSKSDESIHLVGELDELNCVLGLALTQDLDSRTAESILAAQSALFDAGAFVSSDGDIPAAFDALTERMEREMDAHAAKLPPLKNFILPGGAGSSAVLHLARAVCRRAERSAVAWDLNRGQASEMLTFLNRLSDWLFSAARWENYRLDQPDTPWRKST